MLFSTVLFIVQVPDQQVGVACVATRMKSHAGCSQKIWLNVYNGTNWRWYYYRESNTGWELYHDAVKLLVLLK